ncbi:hypothetical protein [Nocardioides sp.]|jgi:hypothetical protein|uniref:hypothetical protein n=1 Tax=Nocardioides sp. TaxID=35761 RepID=UPI00260180B8|nr:hypothetical protein [Nocardioides sp.]
MTARPRGSSRDIDDGTPLNGAQIDIGPRIGWVLRVSRLLHREAAGAGLQAMATKVQSNATRLHRVETGGTREGRLVEKYEEVLGLAPASLQAPIDIVCRTFPEAPVDRHPAPVVATVRELSRLTERLSSVETQPAHLWFAWARALSRSGGIGMPERLAQDLVVRLVTELGRSTSHAYPIRYEALALLRCSDYGHVVLEVAREQIADPDIQVLNDMMSAVGEHVSTDAVAWCLDLLTDPRERVIHGAALALENMGQIAEASDEFWESVVDRIIAVHNASAEDAPGWEWHSHLLRLVPAGVMGPRRHRVSKALAPAPVIASWEREETNGHWADVSRAAASIASELELGNQPMLARLMFDLAISPYESRAVTSYMLLGSIPEIAARVTSSLGQLIETHVDPALRERMLRRLPGMAQGSFPGLASSWLVNGDDDELEAALFLAGASNTWVPADILARALLGGGRVANRALYAAGMTAHPVMGQLLEDPRGSTELAGALGWWQRNGSRVDV